MSELSDALYEMHSLLKELDMPFSANRKLVELGKQFGISKQAARKAIKERDSE